MTQRKKPQLSPEQREQLRAMVKTQARHMLKGREELQEQARVTRQVWQALVASPTWSIVHSEMPNDAPAFDEMWSMIPTVTVKKPDD
jgi:hypothetical protein